MSLSGAIFETFRTIAQAARYFPGPRQCAKEAAWILASNSETAQLLRKMRGSAEGVSAMWPTYYSAAQIKRFQNRKQQENDSKSLQIFAGGTAIGSKGIALALHALRDAGANGIRFEYTIASDGPEAAYLRRLIRALGLEGRVRLVRALRGEEYIAQLHASDCFLLPSFRENLGLTMIEAMLAGAVPVVADTSAPGEIVTNDCGIKVPVTSAGEMVSAIADAITRLARDRRLVTRLGHEAPLRAMEIVSERRYLTDLETAYCLAIRNHCDRLVTTSERQRPWRSPSQFAIARQLLPSQTRPRRLSASAGVTLEPPVAKNVVEKECIVL
jgi:glycosyltransferase involved in cell wall biosynthesis